MALVHESRLDNTVDSGNLGIGEKVEVRTLMGGYVTIGEVKGATPFGVIIREDNRAIDTFYPSNVHLFVVVEQEVEVKAANMLTDMSPDARVKDKLRSMGEAGNEQVGGGASAEPVDKGDDKDKGGDNKKDDKKGDEPEEEAPEDDHVASPESSIDVEELPGDIQKAIISSEKMDEGELNSVLGEISDAAMKGLKRASIKETEIFGLVQKIQASVYRILTGKPLPPKPSPKKAKKKK